MSGAVDRLDGLKLSGRRIRALCDGKGIELEKRIDVEGLGTVLFAICNVSHAILQERLLRHNPFALTFQ
ncbi:hypothetical protein [Roseovarius aestuarii]|nr:hypothetical protein [Roseovarius aestuarii]